MRILHVDPHDGLRDVMGRLLRMRGHEVAGMPALSDAARRLSAGEHFELLITCIEVADGATWYVLPEFKARFPHIKAIAHTSYGLTEDMERIAAAGFDGYVPKPCSVEQLFEAIERLFPGSSLPEPQASA